MGELFWPGDGRASRLFTEQAFVDAMVDVESAWIECSLPPVFASEISSEAAGNPVPVLVELLRERSGNPRVHRGLTSQDVIDTALMICLRDAVAAITVDLRKQMMSLGETATTYRNTPMVARTLTQHAVPTTFGLVVAQWLSGVLDARDELTTLSFPLQLGGAGGTMAAAVEIGRDPVRERQRLAEQLGLTPALPWHTVRRSITRIGDALVACTDSWGRIANDVLTLSRSEISEVSEGTPGGSSTMPHKQNPVLATLVRRAALGAPFLGASLHLAASEQVDQRAAGAWHLEWVTLRDLARRAVVAASQTTDLVNRLEVHADRMAQTLAAGHDAVRAEQMSVTSLSHASGDYLGEAAYLVDAVLERNARVSA